MWPTRQLRTESRTLIIFQEPAHVTPAHTQYPSTKKQVTPTMNMWTYALQVFYKQGWAQRVNLTINNHPSAPEDTPVYMGPQRRQENITAVLQSVWYHLLTDVMGIFNSHSWTPPGWTPGWWSLEFCFPSAQVANPVHPEVSSQKCRPWKTSHWDMFVSQVLCWSTRECILHFNLIWK